MALGSDGESLYAAIHEGRILVLNLTDFTFRILTPYLDSSGPAEPFDIAVVNGYVYVTSRSKTGSRSMRIISADGSDSSGPFEWWARGPAAASASTLLASADGEKLYMGETMSRIFWMFDLTMSSVLGDNAVWSSGIDGLDRMLEARDGNTVYLKSGEARGSGYPHALLGAVSPGVPALNSDGTRVLVGAHDGFFATEGRIIEHDAETFSGLSSGPVSCAPERMAPAVDAEHFLVLGFDAVCLWRYTPTYTFVWPSPPGVQPTPHPASTPLDPNPPLVP
jgi:hypothetical protein